MEGMHTLTDNECAWIRFLRDISLDGGPAPTWHRVQLLWRILTGRRA